jgi:hypothetical protein
VLPSPARPLDRTQLALIVNARDALSVRIGEYYAAQRRIPFQHVIKVDFPPGRTTLTVEEFTAIKAVADEQASPRVQAYALMNARDVLFYFTGKDRVDGLDTLRFLPGAIADHVTSAGGQLTDSSQMSALRWLEAGATGSYGTVVEPCNLPQKFPHPAVVAAMYLRGETLIEAYWKSVAMPGQGVFVGEPLAAPFRRRAALH